MNRLLLCASLTLASCQCDPTQGTIRGNQDAGSDAGTTISDAGVIDAGPGDAGALDAGPECVPPDVLIALDRTLTMHRTAEGLTPADTAAGRATSKWTMAINGIEQLTAAPLDGTVRFGLELWPRAEAGCVTLAQRIQGMNATNAMCQGPEIVIEPGLSTGSAISALLDPETTLICTTTPTGAALIGARNFLEAHQDGGQAQYVVLVTDGADWDFSCPSPNPLLVVDGLADAGIKTLVVGFSAETSLQNGVGAAFLNDLACAGRTAKNFAVTCRTDAPTGSYRAVNPDAGGMDALFFTATNASELAASLRTFSETVCCGCIN
ncbi:MAG: VWA domain-containing protein [Archangium sp.]|nr:VWA domain-containing protein [Archangium sp.]